MPLTSLRSTLHSLAPFACTLLLAAAALAISVSPAAVIALQFDVPAISAGEIWRLATGHFTHWNGEHLLWDLIPFVALGMLVEWRSRRLFVATVATSAIVISIVVGALEPGMIYYRGLSGIDSALYGAVAADLLLLAWQRRSPQMAIIPAALWIAFLGRIGYESITGVSLFVDSVAAGYTPAAIAHLAGGLVGAAIAYWQHRTGLESFEPLREGSDVESIAA